MAEKTATEQIAFKCDEDFKTNVKKTIIGSKIKKLQDGYLEIFQLGFDQFIRGVRWKKKS